MKKRRSVIVAVAVQLSCLHPATADTAISGAGTATCAEFAAAYKQDPKAVETFFVTWVQGFLSGRNSAWLEQGQSSKDLGPDASRTIRSHILRYCDQNPLRTIALAALSLYHSLPTSKFRPPNSK